MEQSDLVFQKLKAKEKEHYDLEDEYLKRKATFTNQYNELYERRDRLARIIETKLAKWMSFFKRDNTVTKMENSFIGVCNN